MQAILTESFLRRSLINTQNSARASREELEDSLDYHSDILAKYGYTFDDFNFTVASMTKRKSNPLEPILNNVLEEIDKQAVVAEYRYECAVRFDTMSLSHYRDTLYSVDSLPQGSFNEYDSVVFVDTTFRKGIYSIEVSYQTMADYRYPTKALKYYFADTVGTKRDIRTMWLSRSSKPRVLSNQYTLSSDNMDSLVFYFTETIPNYVKRKDKDKLAKDTSSVIYFRITYTPTQEEARTRFFRSFYGDDFPIYKEWQPVKADDFEVKIRLPFEKDTVYPPITPEMLRLDSLRLDSLRLDSLRIDSLRIDSLRVDSLRLDSLRLDSLRLDSLKVDSL